VSGTPSGARQSGPPVDALSLLCWPVRDMFPCYPISRCLSLLFLKNLRPHKAHQPGAIALTKRCSRRLSVIRVHSMCPLSSPAGRCRWPAWRGPHPMTGISQQVWHFSEQVRGFSMSAVNESLTKSLATVPSCCQRVKTRHNGV